MFRNVDKPDFWRHRLETYGGDLRRVIWADSDECWDRMIEQHKKVLTDALKPRYSVLDCGCGFGRLLDIMPEWWEGPYLGIDISPELIELARQKHPGRAFVVGDVRDLAKFVNVPKNCKYDLAVAVMLRHMVTADLGKAEWLKMKEAIDGVAKSLLCLEPQEVL